MIIIRMSWNNTLKFISNSYHNATKKNKSKNMSTTQLDEIQWKSPEFIQHLGLNTFNVLDYFAESPFYDRTANNSIVKMQYQNIPNAVLTPALLAQEMKKLVGIEYIILHRRAEEFWIIRKQYRVNPEEAQPLADYYVIGANVYMAPTVKDVISSRLLATVLSMKNAVNEVQKLSQYTPADGHTYKLTPPNQQTSSIVSGSTTRNLGNTPYTPGTPFQQNSNATPANNESQGVSGNVGRGTINSKTMDRLFATSLTATPVYLDEECGTEGLVQSQLLQQQQQHQQLQDLNSQVQHQTTAAGHLGNGTGKGNMIRGKYAVK